MAIISKEKAPGIYDMGEEERLRNVCITQFLPSTWSVIEYYEKYIDLIYTPERLLYENPCKVSYVCRSGLEKCPLTKRLHYHYYVEFRDKVSMNFVKAMFDDSSIHIERRRGTQVQAIAYCTPEFFSKKHQAIKRDYTYVSETEDMIYSGFPKCPGRRTDWIAIHDLIKEGVPASEIFDLFPRKSVVFRNHILRACADSRRRRHTGLRLKRDVHIIWGDAGTGKDHDTIEKYGAENVYELTRDEHGAVWWDGYEGQDVLLISDFKWWLTRDRLLNICGSRMIRVNIKGACEWWTGSTVVITSNFDPHTWYPDEHGTGWKGLGQMNDAFVSRLSSITRYDYTDNYQKPKVPVTKVVKKKNYRLQSTASVTRRPLGRKKGSAQRTHPWSKAKLKSNFRLNKQCLAVTVRKVGEERERRAVEERSRVCHSIKLKQRL